MDLTPTPEQEALRAAARDFLADTMSPQRVAELADSEPGWDAGVWPQLAELGWLGLSVPEAAGGAGKGLLEEAVVFEEAAAALLPAPLFGTVALALPAIVASGDTRLIADVVEGRRRLTLAWAERGGPVRLADASRSQLRASALDNGGESWALTGSKSWVPDLTWSDGVVVVASTPDGRPGLFLVDLPNDLLANPHANLPSDIRSDPQSNLPSDRPSDLPADRGSAQVAATPQTTLDTTRRRTDPLSDSPTDIPADPPVDIPPGHSTATASDYQAGRPANLPSDLPTGIPANLPVGDLTAIPADRIRARVAVTPRASVDTTRRLADLTLDAAPARPLVLGPTAADVLEAIRRRALVLGAAEAVGIADRMQAVGAEHARTRQQFGRAIGVYQAVSHRLADSYTAAELARSLLTWAAWTVDAADPDAALAVPAAAAKAGTVAVDAAETTIQVLGGIGMTWDSGIHRYYKRALALELLDGPPAAHRADLATHLFPASPASPPAA
jgi:alkylation response protein AidB-like acyl-CoA dehydrogenase